jgi:hypothetical protein
MEEFSIDGECRKEKELLKVIRNYGLNYYV